MIDAVAADEAYLQEVLAAAAQEDEFTVGDGLQLCTAAAASSSGQTTYMSSWTGWAFGMRPALCACCFLQRTRLSFPIPTLPARLSSGAAAGGVP